MSKATVFTIGYGQRTLAHVIELLQKHQCRQLVDVRSVPYSAYQTAFNREALEGFREPKYLYLGELLGARSSHADQLRGVDQVLSLDAPCLMCGCLRAESCHRSSVLGPIFAERGVELHHINAFDAIDLQSKLESRNPRQLDLF